MKRSHRSFGIARYSALWLKPVLVSEFDFLEWTADDNLRYSRFVVLREGRKASRIRR